MLNRPRDLWVLSIPWFTHYSGKSNPFFDASRAKPDEQMNPDAMG